MKSRNALVVSSSVLLAALSLGIAQGPARAADAEKGGDAAVAKALDYFRWKQNWPSDVATAVKETKDASIKGMRVVTVELSRGAQKQAVDMLISKDGRYAVFAATVGDVKDSPIKGVKQAEINPGGGRGMQVLISSDGKSIALGALEDVSIDIAAEKAKKEADEAKKAQEALTKLNLTDQPSRGPKDAKVTLVEFSDFQCPYCAKGYTTVEEVLKEYGDKVRLVFKNFPLGFHPWAEPSALAGECVFEQDEKAFWTLYEYYFTHQKDLTQDNLKEKSLEALKGTKVDAGKFKECFDGKKLLDRVKADETEGQQVGVNGTPAFFINGRFLNGAVPAQQFKDIIDQELKRN